MIGIFDSGVGGLSVVKEITKILPSHQLIYFGDTARLPYGTKGSDFIKKYSSKITEWLLDRGAKVIVVACHTSSAQSADFLKKRFKDVPIFEMIAPTIKKLKIEKLKRVGVIGTPGTINSKAWDKQLLKVFPNLKIISKACPLFVPLVEEGWIDKKITTEVAKEYLSKLKNLDALILACTHYPMLKKIIEKTVNIKIVDPAQSLAEDLGLYLNKNPQIKAKIGKEHQFFFSDTPYNLDKISQMCLNKKINPIINDPF
jgi:glutamate racemase